MLGEEEKQFMHYWEQNRVKQGRWQYQLFSGLPWSFIVFGIPIIINLAVGRFWYKRLPYISPGEVNFILIAVALLSIFYAMFRKKFLWEQYEQRYKELLLKEQPSSDN